MDGYGGILGFIGGWFDWLWDPSNTGRAGQKLKVGGKELNSDNMGTLTPRSTVPAADPKVAAAIGVMLATALIVEEGGVTLIVVGVPGPEDVLVAGAVAAMESKAAALGLKLVRDVAGAGLNKTRQLFRLVSPTGEAVATAEAKSAAKALQNEYNAFASKNIPNRVTTPNAAARAKSQGKYIDPLTNKIVKTTDTLAADHIFPKARIKELPGFNKLTPAQQSEVLNNLDNFRGLPKSLNASKGRRIDWSTYKGQPLDRQHAAELAELQQVMNRELQAQIDALLGGRK